MGEVDLLREACPIERGVHGILLETCCGCETALSSVRECNLIRHFLDRFAMASGQCRLRCAWLMAELPWLFDLSERSWEASYPCRPHFL
jgi:hypothetical protein